ncbi:hypothetical protein B0T16DRAFT_125562 [Cercophora newfieldiana]|uniref:Uncharacterized protein n=1 Tax=Cercophora newfieldiana TaxID=92897 RepID=A0AA39YBZ2_9PEZI|nr:hypothetical protein B0T16DRAFT_125562 [Cercophora newfieldiana]
MGDQQQPPETEKGSAAAHNKSNDATDQKPVDPPEGFDISNLGLFLFPSIPRGRLQRFPWLSDCPSKLFQRSVAKTPSPPPGPRVESLPPSPKARAIDEGWDDSDTEEAVRAEELKRKEKKPVSKGFCQSGLFGMKCKESGKSESKET